MPEVIKMADILDASRTSLTPRRRVLGRRLLVRKTVTYVSVTVLGLGPNESL